MRTPADRLAAAVAERDDLDALLVTDPFNVHWATGFTGTSGWVVIGADGREFITDFRYVERAAEEVDDSFTRHRAEQELLDALEPVLGGVTRLGFDDAKVAVRTHGKLAGTLGEGVELVAAGGLVETLRAVKTDAEIRRIREAASIADEAARATIAPGLAGRTEEHVARVLLSELRARGAEPSFPPIVAAGPRGSRPHAEPGPDVIERDTLVVFDWGALIEGYCSDCTRTFATGELDEEATAVYELVRTAQAAALDAVQPGPTGKEVDAVAREIIEEGGHGERFGHGLGHGVGLEVHEEPRLSKRGTDALAAGQVVTVEPGVYLPGRFGVRIEDLAVITESGPPLVLSSLSKDLTRVD